MYSGLWWSHRLLALWHFSLAPLASQFCSGLRKLRLHLAEADSSNPVPYNELCYSVLLSHSSPSVFSRKVITLVKNYLTHRYQLNAREFLRGRLSKVSWLGHSSSSAFDTLHVTPVKVIPSFARLAILGWLIDSEADMRFRLRPHVARSAPCRCGCGVHSSIYPDGFSAALLLRRISTSPLLGSFIVKSLGPLLLTGSLIPLITLPFRPLLTLVGSLVTVLSTRRSPSSPPISEPGRLFLACYAAPVITRFSIGSASALFRP